MAREQGRRRRNRDSEPVLVGDVLASAARSVGLSPDMASLVCDSDAWARVVGADLAEAGAPVRFSDGTLVVVPADAIGETRLRYAAEAVRLAVNEHLGRDEVAVVAVRRPDNRWRMPLSP